MFLSKLIETPLAGVPPIAKTLGENVTAAVVADFFQAFRNETQTQFLNKIKALGDLLMEKVTELDPSEIKKARAVRTGAEWIAQTFDQIIQNLRQRGTATMEMKEVDRLFSQLIVDTNNACTTASMPLFLIDDFPHLSEKVEPLITLVQHLEAVVRRTRGRVTARSHFHFTEAKKADDRTKLTTLIYEAVHPVEETKEAASQLWLSSHPLNGPIRIQTVFVVDDDPPLRVSLAARWRRAGISDVQSFSSYSELLIYIDDHDKISDINGGKVLLAIDLEMPPPNDCYQVCKKMREIFSSVPLPIFLCSSRAEEYVNQKARRVGFTGRISKDGTPKAYCDSLIELQRKWNSRYIKFSI